MYTFRGIEKTSGMPRHICFTVLDKDKRLFSVGTWSSKTGRWTTIMGHSTFMDSPYNQKDFFHKYYNYDKK